jgi:hypothetical protein
MRAFLPSLVLVFASCTTTDDGELMTEPPPEEPPTVPEPPSGESLAQASERVLGQFRDCMTFADFQSANMAAAWAGLSAVNNQQCRNCHSTGGEGFIASDQAQQMFDTLKQDKFHLLQYVTVDLVNGAAAAKVIVNRRSFQGVGLAQAPHAEHPRFNPDVNQGMTALQAFYNLTMQRITDVCAPSPL